MDNLDTYTKKTLLEKTEGAVKNRQTRDIETLEQTEGAITNDNPEKQATLGKQDTGPRQKQNKEHNTICVGHQHTIFKI